MTNPTPYTYQPGAIAAPGKLRKANLSEVTNELLCHSDWAGVLAWNLFREEPVVHNPPFPMIAEKEGMLTVDLTRLREWFEVSLGLQVSKELMADAFESACRTRAFHPVLDYLEALEPCPFPDKVLDEVATQAFNADTDIERLFVRRWLIAAIRRVVKPGTKVDNCLVLVGPQNKGKSSAVRILFGDWMKEDLDAIGNKDALVGMQGTWCVEIAELQAVLRADPAAVKSFITRLVDKYRAPYERRAVDHPRTAVFFGTTNEDDWMRDVTGERRWWPVKCPRVNLEWLQANRDRIWSAAVQLAMTDEPHWLNYEQETIAETHRDQFRFQDSAEQVVQGYLHGRAGKEVSVHDVWSAVHPGSVGFAPQAESTRIGRLLKKLGCTCVVSAGGFKRWRVPESYGKTEERKGLRAVKGGS